MLPSSLLAHVLLWAAAAAAINRPRASSSDVDFSAYPATTVSCLTRAADQAGCASEDTVTATNGCLCSDTGDFVTLAAQCVGDQGEQALLQVYATMQDSCTQTKTPLSVSQADFLAAADAAAVSRTTITSTVTTTGAAGEPTTFTTTSTSTSGPATGTATPTVDDDSDDDDAGQITVSAKAGAIAASVAGALMIACVVCLVVLLKKRKKDKALLQQVRDEASRGGKPLLDPDATTPGLPPSPTGTPGAGARNASPVTFGASVTPPTPSYMGPTSPQGGAWRSTGAQPAQAPYLGAHALPPPNRALAGQVTATTTTPSMTTTTTTATSSSSPSQFSGGSQHWPYELYDSSSRLNQVGGQEPSPVSQGIGTMGSWCPSPLSGVASSTALGPYGGTGTGTMGSSSSSAYTSTYGLTGTAGTGSTVGAISTLSQSLGARQITGTTRSSWAHNRPVQDELYELPGTEVRSINPLPVEADSNPITVVPEQLSMSISQAPPQYEPGGWIDPNTDKPPIGMI